MVVGSQQTCPLSAHLSPVAAALHPLVPSPLTTYCHLLAAPWLPARTATGGTQLSVGWEEGASSKWRLQWGHDAVDAAAGLSYCQYQL